MTNKILIDPLTQIDHTRYNGGWIKEIINIDKKKNNGYSLVGDFMATGLTPYEPFQLYLDCSIGGSRKNQTKTYTLFYIDPDKNVHILQKLENWGRDWACHLWDEIEAYWAREKADEEKNPLSEYTTEQLINELEDRGIKILTNAKPCQCDGEIRVSVCNICGREFHWKED